MDGVDAGPMVSNVAFGLAPDRGDLDLGGRGVHDGVVDDVPVGSPERDPVGEGLQGTPSRRTNPFGPQPSRLDEAADHIVRESLEVGHKGGEELGLLVERRERGFVGLAQPVL
jgi:hypothetical protein